MGFSGLAGCRGFVGATVERCPDRASWAIVVDLAAVRASVMILPSAIAFSNRSEILLLAAADHLQAPSPACLQQLCQYPQPRTKLRKCRPGSTARPEHPPARSTWLPGGARAGGTQHVMGTARPDSKGSDKLTRGEFREMNAVLKGASREGSGGRAVNAIPPAGEKPFKLARLHRLCCCSGSTTDSTATAAAATTTRHVVRPLGSARQGSQGAGWCAATLRVGGDP